jgi:hypothetical protein
MNKNDALRILDGLPARFLRFGKAGFIVVSAANLERELETRRWMGLPIWSSERTAEAKR